MTEAETQKNYFEGIARLVQTAFLEIRASLHSGTVSKELRKAIDSLPHDRITKEAGNRLRKFPNDCCADASAVLAVIFSAIAEQNGFELELKHIRCYPTDKTKTVMFDYHQWLQVQGYAVDITFEQCKTVLKGNEGKVIFEVHPLIDSDDYKYGQATATIEEPWAEFANYIIMTYFKRPRQTD